jgi:hypothetical protein
LFVSDEIMAIVYLLHNSRVSDTGVTRPTICRRLCGPRDSFACLHGTTAADVAAVVPLPRVPLTLLYSEHLKTM